MRILLNLVKVLKFIVKVSSEWGAPNTYVKGFNPAHVAEGKYGRNIYFWVIGFE